MNHCCRVHIDDLVVRLQNRLAELIGEGGPVRRYVSVRGPEGIMVALAEQLGKQEA